MLSHFKMIVKSTFMENELMMSLNILPSVIRYILFQDYTTHFMIKKPKASLRQKLILVQTDTHINFLNMPEAERTYSNSVMLSLSGQKCLLVGWVEHLIIKQVLQILLVPMLSFMENSPKTLATGIKGRKNLSHLLIMH